MEWVEDRSSNICKLFNLTLAIKEAYLVGLLCGCELLMFTDNTTAESVFYKCTSLLDMLFNLGLVTSKFGHGGRFGVPAQHTCGWD